MYKFSVFYCSIFAKEAKFRDVYACERSSTMCDLIERVIVANQCQDDITIIAKNSTELISGTDFPERYFFFIASTLKINSCLYVKQRFLYAHNYNSLIALS